MNLSEFSYKIDRLAAQYPDAKVVYSTYRNDDDGMNFGEVLLDPTVGYIDEDDNFSTKRSEVNRPAKRAICIN